MWIHLKNVIIVQRIALETKNDILKSDFLKTVGSDKKILTNKLAFLINTPLLGQLNPLIYHQQQSQRDVVF